MAIAFRLFTGFIGAIVGVIIALLYDLTVGGGLQLVPVSEFITPLSIAAIIGFIFGFGLHKIMRKILGFLGYFSLESS